VCFENSYLLDKVTVFGDGGKIPFSFENTVFMHNTYHFGGNTSLF
jgi:hypothetical protein